MEENKHTTIQINVPYRGPGNTITNKSVDFDIVHQDGCYKAAPLLDTAERTVANLPPELSFYYNEGKATSTRGIKDGNLHVILEITEVLKANNMF